MNRLPVNGTVFQGNNDLKLGKMCDLDSKVLAAVHVKIRWPGVKNLRLTDFKRLAGMFLSLQRWPVIS